MMSDSITTKAGIEAGNWNGHSVEDLRDELNRIRDQLRESGSDDKLVTAGIPHRDQLPEDLRSFAAYPIWGCDQHSNCLCGARANRIVSVEDVRQYSLIDHH